MSTGVLLADDEHLVRAGLRALLEAEPDLCVLGEAPDGTTAVAYARRLRPQVVLMDVRMPGLDGLRATRTILTTVPHPPKILIVTTFEHDENVYAALRAGAHGFLLKRARPAEILHAIRVVMAGDTLLFPDAIRGLAERYARRAAPWPGLDRLTDRESAVLRLVATGLSNAEIGQRLGVRPQTVKTHVGNVLAKLQARDRTQAVIAAYESGFIMPG